MIKEQGQGQIWLCLFLFMPPPKKNKFPSGFNQGLAAQIHLKGLN